MSVEPPTRGRCWIPQRILELQTQASEVFVHNLVAEYIVRLVLATRTPAEFNLPDLASVIQLGCSPRATLGLVAAARALALIHGRDYVLPTDVQSVAKDVMVAPLVLGFDAVADNIQPGPGDRADHRHGAAAHPGVERRTAVDSPAARWTACPAAAGGAAGLQLSRMSYSAPGFPPPTGAPAYPPPGGVAGELSRRRPARPRWRAGPGRVRCAVVGPR